MFARVTTIEGSSERIDEVTRYARERVLPAMQGQPGFKGMHLLIDRQNGKALGITLWETEEALQTSEAAAQRMRSDAVDRGAGKPPTAEVYEVTLQA